MRCPAGGRNAVGGTAPTACLQSGGARMVTKDLILPRFDPGQSGFSLESGQLHLDRVVAPPPARIVSSCTVAGSAGRCVRPIVRRRPGRPGTACSTCRRGISRAVRKLLLKRIEPALRAAAKHTVPRRARILLSALPIQRGFGHAHFDPQRDVASQVLKQQIGFLGVRQTSTKAQSFVRQTDKRPLPASLGVRLSQTGWRAMVKGYWA